jgi:hypothetical protein
MKKLITILLLLTIISCGNETPKNMLIVGDIEAKKDYCIYYATTVNANSTQANLFGSWYAAIGDSCGKYTVGDTIVFSKK